MFKLYEVKHYTIIDILVVPLCTVYTIKSKALMWLSSVYMCSNTQTFINLTSYVFKSAVFLSSLSRQQLWTIIVQDITKESLAQN